MGEVEEAISKGFFDSLWDKFGIMINNLWKKILNYPVSIEYINQFETKIGYVISLNIYSLNDRPFQIKRNNIKIKIKKDKNSLKKSKFNKLIDEEYIIIIDTKVLLDAFIDGRSTGNIPSYLWVRPEAEIRYFLIQVKGPGSQNPSARFQFCRAYMAIDIYIRKYIWKKYGTIPLKHFPIIAGNTKTKIIDT